MSCTEITKKEFSHPAEDKSFIIALETVKDPKGASCNFTYSLTSILFMTVAQIAKNLGVHAATLQGWISKYYPKVRPSVKSPSQESSLEELKQLRKENTRLREERDILKKAAAYFAGEIR